jgi:hypothetical protein
LFSQLFCDLFLTWTFFKRFLVVFLNSPCYETHKSQLKKNRPEAVGPGGGSGGAQCCMQWCLTTNSVIRSTKPQVPLELELLHTCPGSCPPALHHSTDIDFAPPSEMYFGLQTVKD